MFEKGLLSFWWDFVDKINALVHNTKSNINLGEVIKYKNTLKYKYELNLTYLVTYTRGEIVIALSFEGLIIKQLFHEHALDMKW